MGVSHLHHKVQHNTDHGSSDHRARRKGLRGFCSEPLGKERLQCEIPEEKQKNFSMI